MNIPLSADIEHALTQAAQQRGTTPEELAASYVQSCLAPHLAAQSDQSSAKSLADFLGDYIGCIDSSVLVPGGANMSADTGKKFTELLLKQREQGRK